MSKHKKTVANVEKIDLNKNAIRKSSTKALQPVNQSVVTESYVGAPRKYKNSTVKMVNHMSGTLRRGVVSAYNPHGKEAINPLYFNSQEIMKTATCYPATGSGASGYGSRGGDIINSLPSFYDPYFEPSTLVLPRNLLEINSWCRYFYKYDPYVSTAIDMHAELPLSKMRLQPPKCEDKNKSLMILNHYEKMIGTDGIDLYNKLLQVGVEYYKLGNVYPWLQLNQDKTAWEKLTLLDPDYIVIEKLQFTNAMSIELIANDRLREIINRGHTDQRTGVLAETIPEEVRDLVMKGKNIPLSVQINESHVSHITRKMGDYEVLGTSLIERNFKALVYKDRLRRSQDAIAVRHLTPKHLIWTDSNANNVDVEAIREQVEQALIDPDYAIVTNFQINWELVGTNQSLMQLSAEWEWINDELMIGLMLNKSFVMGEGAFANGQTVLEVLEQRYAIYRATLEGWCEHHIFKPIAELNNFKEKRRGYVKDQNGNIVETDVEVLLYPKIKWNRLNLTDDNQHKQLLSQMVERGFLDVESWLEYFGIDAEIIIEKIKRYEGTPLDPNYQSLQQSIQSSIGNILGPAIAKVKAEEMGLELPQDQMSGFASTDEEPYVKMGVLHSNSIEDMPITTQNLYHTLVNAVTKEIMERLGETRDTRQLTRKTRKKQRAVEDAVQENEIDLEKRVLPPRPDLYKKSKPKLFDANTHDIEIIKDSDIVKKNSMMEYLDWDTMTNSTYSPVEKEI